MDGEISSLMQAILIMGIGVIAFVGMVTDVATSYSKPVPAGLTQISSLTNQINQTASLTENMSKNLTQNDWTQVFMLTSGSLQIIATMVLSIPTIMNVMIRVFITSTLTPVVGADPAGQSFIGLVILSIQTLILATVAFAGFTAITKVKL